jgi:hypothetical protein
VTGPAEGSPQPLRLPERRLFWHWVWSAVRPVLGWVLAGLGALALFLGWWGVSGQALTSKQLPYVVSGGLTGVALVILAGVFLATDDVRQQLSRLDRLERKVDDLYALFVAADTPVEQVDAHLVALPSGASFHRADCALVAGKQGVTEVDDTAIAERGLRACRVCDPATPRG